MNEFFFHRAPNPLFKQQEMNFLAQDIFHLQILASHRLRKVRPVHNQT